MDASFDTLYSFFSPFFFIGIGLSIDPAALDLGVMIGAVLFTAATLGNLTGQGLPIFLIESQRSGWRQGRIAFLVLGFSMVPRAEIAMIIMQNGLKTGKWAVTSSTFNGMVVASLLTCVIAPILVRALLKKWPQSNY